MSNNNIEKQEYTLFENKLFISDLLNFYLSDVPSTFVNDLENINYFISKLTSDFCVDSLIWGDREVEFIIWISDRSLSILIGDAYPFLGHVCWDLNLDDRNSYNFLQDLNSSCADYENIRFWEFSNYENYFKPFFKVCDLLGFNIQPIKSDLTNLFIHFDNRVEYEVDIGPLSIIVFDEPDMLKLIHNPSKLCVHFTIKSFFVSIYDNDYEDNGFQIEKDTPDFWSEFEMKMKEMIKLNRNIDIAKLEDFFTIEEMLNI